MGTIAAHLQSGELQIGLTPCHSSKGGIGKEPGWRMRLYAERTLSNSSRASGSVMMAKAEITGCALCNLS